MTGVRRRLAAALRAWAQRLDPAPSVTRQPGGGWTVDLGGVPLARVTAGRVVNQRPTRQEADR